MSTGHVFIAASLDGFVARLDDSIDWLLKQQTAGEDHGYEAFITSVDGLVMGSGSFRQALAFDTWPYKKPVVVMSHSLCEADVPEALRTMVSVTRLAPEVLMAELDRKGWQRVYIDGGLVVQSFLRAGLIADLVVTIIPILLGSGKRLFGPTPNDVDLQLLSAQSFPSGLLRTHYRVMPS